MEMPSGVTALSTTVFGSQECVWPREPSGQTSHENNAGYKGNVFPCKAGRDDGLLFYFALQKRITGRQMSNTVWWPFSTVNLKQQDSYL